MALDRVEPDLRHVVDRRTEADSLGDRWGPGLELVGKLVPGRPLHRDRADHLAAEIERSHGLEQLATPPERADTARAAHLVRREREKLAVERLNVDRAMRRRLRGVHDHDRAALVRPGGEALHRIDGSERVRDQVRRNDLHVPFALELVERLEAELTALIDGDCAKRRSGSTCNVLPWDEARMVLQIGDDYDIALLEIVEAPGIRDEIERLGGTAGEDHLTLGRCVDVRRDLATRSLVAGRRPFRKPVDPAMDVRIRVLVEVSHRVQHLARLLCRSRGIEVCDGLPVDELVEHREVGAQAFRVELRMCGYGHDRIVPPSYRLTPGSSI